MVLSLVLLAIGLASQSPAGAAPPRPQIFGIAHVALQTADLEKARHFYGELLGYREISSGKTNTAVFAVNERQRLIVTAGLPPRDERLVALAFDTADVDGMRRFLAGGGMDAGETVRDTDAGGRYVDVHDPDGHRLRFVERDMTPAQASSGADDRRISRRLLHAGLTIRDVASADRFYRDLLGFSELWRGGRTPDETSWINMRVPDGTEYLEYMLTAGGSLDRRQLGTMHHIALVVPDMQEALMMVRSRTASDDPNHRAVPQVGRNKKWQLNLHDPDGTRVEFMEPWTTRD